MIHNKLIKTLSQLFIAIMVFGSVAGFAQSGTIQVVTKTINKTIPYKNHDLLKINAEKAEVEINGWDKNYIQLTLKLISKNKKREDAEEDLQYLKYKISNEGNDIVLSNYFQTPDTRTRIKSNLQAKYILNVPKKLNANVNVLYGEVNINNVSGSISSDINFGMLKVNNVTGKLSVKSTYGDITAKDLNVFMTCEADKANINLMGIKGTYAINSSYGTLVVETSQTLKGFKVVSKNTEVKMTLLAFEEYNYNLSTSYADITVPDHYSGMIDSRITQKKEFVNEFKPNNPSIQIATTFSNITIQSINTLSKK